MMKFDLPKDQSNIIKVIGVGGGGSNAVNHMYKEGITGVDFLVCNTDRQALDTSPVPIKIQLGVTLTEGLGAGAIAERGKDAAIENIEEITQILEKNTKMVFITAGMGGGTGTGAAPVIAKIAKELGILTVAIVTLPFGFEGKKRRLQAEEGINQLKEHVDTLLIICNERLRQMGGNLRMSEAFAKADNILTNASKSIAEIITVTGYVNVDFEDVRTVMEGSGVAIMGSATAEGENRAMIAVEKALSSPLLNDNNIKGATKVLLSINSGDEEITMDEVCEINDYIQEEAGMSADIIMGQGYDPSLGNKIGVTIVATGFDSKSINEIEGRSPERKVMSLTEETKVVVVEKIEEEPQAFNEPTLKESTESTETVFEINGEKQEQVNMFDDEVSNDYSNEEPTFHIIEEEPYQQQEVQVEKQVQDDIAKSRIARLKELSLKIKSSSGMNEMENIPAYKRREVQFENTPHSSDSQVSRYTLTENEGKTEIKPNNSFLHDNVD